MLVIIDTMFDEDRFSLSRVCSDLGFKIVSFDPPSPKLLKTKDGAQYASDVVERMLAVTEPTAIVGSHWVERYVNPSFYNRASLVGDEEQLQIAEMEQSLGALKFFVAPSPTAHMVHGKNVTQSDVQTLRGLYSKLPSGEYKKLDYEGAVVILKAVAEGKDPAEATRPKEKIVTPVEVVKRTSVVPVVQNKPELSLDAKLTAANAIKSVLVKSKIIKGKGPEFDTLDSKVRSFLETELASIFGAGQQSQNFSSQEAEILRALCSTVKRKQGEK